MDIKYVDRMDAKVPQALLDLIVEVAGGDAVAARNHVVWGHDSWPHQRLVEVMSRICGWTSVKGQISSLSRNDQFFARCLACGFQVTKRLSHSTLATLTSVIDGCVDNV